MKLSFNRAPWIFHIQCKLHHTCSPTVWQGELFSLSCTRVSLIPKYKTLLPLHLMIISAKLWLMGNSYGCCSLELMSDAAFLTHRIDHVHQVRVWTLWSSSPWEHSFHLLFTYFFIKTVIFVPNTSRIFPLLTTAAMNTSFQCGLVRLWYDMTKAQLSLWLTGPWN